MGAGWDIKNGKGEMGIKIDVGVVVGEDFLKFENQKRIVSKGEIEKE